MATTILIVDDDRAVRSACEAIVSTLGFTCISVASAREGLAVLESTPVDVVLTDLRMPGMNGLEFLGTLRKVNPNLFVVLMSGYGSIESAVEAMQQGAFSFIRKPFLIEELQEILGDIQGELELNNSARKMRCELDKLGGLPMVVGKSPEMQRNYRMLMGAARSSFPVLIQGEYGTGKELLARSIHLAANDCAVPFVPVDCCSLVPELLENVLFGHVKGAFPGALTNRAGLLAGAECGTVFLNEIAELSIEAQTKVARALQARSFRPYGGIKDVPFQARIMASSSHDLASLVAAGSFRQDLYYMLNVLVLRLPSLRQRKEDIPLFAEHFLGKMSQECGIVKRIDAETLRALEIMDWPGNIAELETVLQRAYALAAGTSITLLDIPHIEPPSPTSKDFSNNLSLADIERKSVLQAVKDCGGDKQKAARQLGISRTTLYRKLSEYDSLDCQ